MGQRGRPLKGKESRDAKIVICIENQLKDALGQLATDSRRTLSDYCHYVLEQHVLYIAGEAGGEGDQPEALHSLQGQSGTL